MESTGERFPFQTAKFSLKISFVFKELSDNDLKIHLGRTVSSPEEGEI